MTGALLRYNLRVLVFNNWWLVVFPIAVSQATVFWTIITNTPNEIAPVRTVETVTPLLAAFLCAHVLSAEYRSRIGAILASKPIDAHKVVFWRLVAAFGLVFVLALLSLLAFNYGLGAFDMGRAFLAAVPSTLFLGLLALTFATIFRNPLAGFGAAALYWALDLPPGPPLHPFLSLRSYTNALIAADTFGAQPLSEPWWIAKGTLLLGAALLYYAHGRALFTLGTGASSRTAKRGVLFLVILLAAYILTGAVLKVAYGYANRGKLIPDDAAWFRKEFASYGPIPVSSLFGPAFKAYLGSFPKIWRINPDEDAQRWDDSPQHRRALRSVIEDTPNSMWAPSAAELLGRLEEAHRDSIESALALYGRIIDKYPQSPYQEQAIRGSARALAEVGRKDEAREMYETFLDRVPNSRYRTEAVKFLIESDIERGALDSALMRAKKWAESAPIHEKFSAHLAAAAIHQKAGRVEEAIQEAQRTLESSNAFRSAVVAKQVPANQVQIVKWQGDSANADNLANGILEWGRAAK
jgi:ABC-type transport system involved in multi-copper enzyme maturation permease subunit